MRRSLAGLVACVSLLLLTLSPAQPQDQTVRIVFPFAVGGSGDALARLMAEALRAGINRPVIVQNVTGGAGRVGTRTVATAAPDGNTILITPIAPVVLYHHLYKDLDYDPFKNLTPITQAATFEFGLAVGDKVPAKDLKEVVEWLKANPKLANYGSPGAGTLPHFFAVLFGRAAGAELVHVAYRGSAPALTDLMGGQIPILVTTTSDMIGQHNEKRIRILATSDAQRSPLAPDVPTFREAGYDIQGTAWYGMFAPAGTPAEIVKRYASILGDALKTKELKDRLLNMGLYATGTTPEEMGRIQKADSDHWAPVIKASGFTPEQ